MNFNLIQMKRHPKLKNLNKIRETVRFKIGDVVWNEEWSLVRKGTYEKMRIAAHNAGSIATMDVIFDFLNEL